MRALWLALLLAGCSGAIHAENDLFSGLHSNSDKYFTHGTKLSYIKETDEEKESYSIGQNIYTPSVKYTRASDVREILEKDRPYAGYLYGEFRNTRLRSETTRDTFGVQLGCSGPCSGARQTQQEFHRQINQSVPLWDPAYTLRQEWGVILEAERSYLLASGTYHDFRAYGAGKTGNLIDSGAIGFDLRFGYNLDTFISDPIIFKIPKDRSPWTAYLFGRVEERAVLLNHFLDGSMFHKERHTVTSEPLVSEGDLGFTVGYENFKLTYRFTIFSNEWEERKGSFSFGGIDLKW